MIVCAEEIEGKQGSEIQQGLNSIRDLLEEKKLQRLLPKDLFDTLQNILEPTSLKPIVRVFVDRRLEAKGCGYQSGYCVWVRPASFEPQEGGGARRLAAVLFHELVHVAGGWELDAEYFENLVFRNKGATWPDAGDWHKFGATKYEGWWVYLDDNDKHVKNYYPLDLETFYDRHPSEFTRDVKLRKKKPVGNPSAKA